MAYQTHGHDPLLDQKMQAALQRRGRELLGLGLCILGVMAAMMIISYSPDDPNWMVVTDAPVQNWLGRAGATIAAPLFMIVGWGAFGLAVLFLAWGMRFTFDWGRERAFGRLIFAPIAIALASVYAATLNLPEGWSHSFGMGGLFGDTVLMMILQIAPGTAALGAKLVSLIAGVLIALFGAFVIGFTWPELYRLTRWMVVGLVLFYAFAMKLVGRGAKFGAKASLQAAQTYQAQRAARRERQAQDEADWTHQLEASDQDAVDERYRVAQVIRANIAAEQASETAPVEEAKPYRDAPEMAAERPGVLRTLMPSLTRKEMPEPELVAPEPAFDDVPETSQDRLRSKIAKAIRARGATPAPAPTPAPTASFVRPEPRLSRPPERLAPQEAASVPQAALDEQTALRPTPLGKEPVSPEAMHAPLELTNPIETAGEARVAHEPDEVIDTGPASEEMPVAAPLPRAHAPIPSADPKRVVQHPPKKRARPSSQAMAEAQPALAFEDTRLAYEHPPLSLLMNPDEIERHHLSDDALEENARMLESVLDDYGVKGEIVSVRPGPVVTMYELEPAPGLKASRVIGLSDDIARSMSALSARVSTVPGRSVIGIELPNDNREMVALREILSGQDFGDTNMRLPLALGKDIGGDPIVANLAKMPHLLIAGTTGSGKSVAINTMILSLLYKLSPEECRLIMIDPKMLELSVYDGIPHLLSPVVTDPKKAVVALKWVVGEMEDRYRKMSKMGVRNIEGFNSRVEDALSKEEMFTRTVQTGFDEETGEPIFETEESMPIKLPYIVVIVDEMADLMMVAGKEIEACIQRLAQMARASGIHLIMATQRPSVDVITGTIKANFPTRISFQVTSKVDSRTILGEMGAEQLLGMGDMLYMAGGAKITRVHGPFCSDEEVEEIVTYLKAYGPPEYVGGVLDGPSEEKENDIDLVLGIGGNTDGEDALYDQAVAIVIKDRKCSTSYIQRKLAIGYNKAARLVEQMEDEGVVSAANHVGKREILVPEQG
ncbi:MAG: DNA translocase FtsK 4TM domain-containing protein [Pseudomonadota bacterium]